MWKLLALAVLGVGLASGFATIARATTVTTYTFTDNNAPTASSTAAITPGFDGVSADPGDLLVVLTNTLNGNGYKNYSAGQEISGIKINFANGTTITSVTSTPESATGTLVNIPSGGTISPNTINHWDASEISSSSLHLTTLTGGMPYDLIAGLDITDPNSSITNFNPSIQNVGTFVIDVAGITLNSAISSVVIEYGTNPDTSDTVSTFTVTTTNLGGAATPLPAALPLFASGLGALGLLGWRRKRKGQTVA